MPFDPDAYLAKKQGAFNPEAYLAKGSTPTQTTGNGDIWKGSLTALQGAGLGFMDELAGVGGAVAGQAANLVGVGDNRSFAEDYRTIRDKYRGDVKAFARDNPMSSLGLNIAGSIPTAVVAVPSVSMSALPAMARLPAQAGVIGAGYGATAGLGASEADSIGGMAADTAKGGAVGFGAGAVAQPVTQVLGAVGSNVAQRFGNDRFANEAARVKLAESIHRGTDSGNPYSQAQARLSKLGAEGTVADVSSGTRTLLDTVVTQPGKTEAALHRIIRNRQGTRSETLTKAADSALGTHGTKADAAVEALVNSRKAAAKPLYDMVRDAPVAVDNELLGILEASSKYHGDAQTVALVKQEIGRGDKLIDGTLGATIQLKHLDRLKQTLYDAAQAQKKSPDGDKTLGAALDELRHKLINYLDRASPKDRAGQSIYKQARDAYAGDSQLIGAVEAGRGALKEGADSIVNMTNKMSPSEVEMFRVGVLQSLREKLGSQAGVTSVINMWKNPNTRNPLKAVFGNDFKKFSAEVYRQEQLKLLEGVGKGSQTAKRQYAAGDLDMMPIGDIGAAVASAKSGSVAGLLSAGEKAWNRVAMPETTRNQLGKLLLTKGKAGEAEINNLQALMEGINKSRASRAGSIGAELGYQSGRVSGN